MVVKLRGGGCTNPYVVGVWSCRFNGKPLHHAPESWLTSIPLSGKLNLTFSSTAPSVAPDWGFRLKLAEFVLADKTDAILL